MTPGELDDLGDVVVTSVIETRVVEATLGARYAAYRYEAPPDAGAGPVVVLVPHRVRALYRRAVATWLGDRPGWVPTGVVVVGRAAPDLTRWERHLLDCPEVHPTTADPTAGAATYACGRVPPVERRRVYADVAAAPDWVGDVVRALAVADAPGAGRRLRPPNVPNSPTADRGGPP